MKPRGTLTENLADVLHALQLARKTGFLVLERSRKDGAVEQGTLMLSGGQITEANVGIYRGAPALDFLMKWSPCYFIFQPPSSTPTPPQFSPTPSQQQRSPTGKYPSIPSLPSVPSVSPLPSAPYRTQQVEMVLPRFNSLGLSRSHRQLFLLVDGQRSLIELARLMGRNADELEGLLIDLARTGLIHL